MPWGPVDGIVEFPDGRRVRGAGLHARRRDVPTPDVAIYLQARDPQISEWPYRWVRWRDFGLPSSSEDAVDALREVHARARSERVEIACSGGVGRTGTALAVLAIMSGVDAEESVGWVREHYHPRAVETRRQRRWVVEVAAMMIR